MNLFCTHKQIEEMDKDVKSTGIKVLKTTLDELAKDGYTCEQRKLMADSAKKLLDSHTDRENARVKYEFSSGRVSGFFGCLKSQAVGIAIGVGVSYIIRKVK